MAKAKEKVIKEEPIEKQLWKSADKLRKNIDASVTLRPGAPMCLATCSSISSASSPLRKERRAASSIRREASSSSLSKCSSLTEDIKGFCNSAGIERVKELDYVLTPGRYVGLPDDEDDFDFNERFTALKSEFESQLVEEAKLNQAILENLKMVKLV